MRLSITIAALCAVLCLSHTSQADVTYAFEGVVESLSPFLGDGFELGMPIQGKFTFDPDTADSLSADPLRSSFMGAISSMSLTVGDYAAVSLLPGDIATVDSDDLTPLPLPHRDSYTAVVVANGEEVNGHPLFLTALQILDFDGDGLTGDGITPPLLDNFSDRLITVDFQPVGTSQNRVIGQLTTLTIVPEPTSFALVCVIGFALPFARRCTKRNRHRGR